MNVLVILIPVSLTLGILGLLAYVWSLKTRQYDDPAGNAERILMDGDDAPLTRSHPSSCD